MEPLTKKETVIDHVATGAAMRKRRKALSISSKHVADKLGFHKSYLSDLEAGRRNWSEELVTRYLYALKQLNKPCR